MNTALHGNEQPLDGKKEGRKVEKKIVTFNRGQRSSLQAVHQPVDVCVLDLGEAQLKWG